MLNIVQLHEIVSKEVTETKNQVVGGQKALYNAITNGLTPLEFIDLFDFGYCNFEEIKFRSSFDDIRKFIQFSKWTKEEKIFVSFVLLGDHDTNNNFFFDIKMFDQIEKFSIITQSSRFYKNLLRNGYYRELFYFIEKHPQYPYVGKKQELHFLIAYMAYLSGRIPSKRKDVDKVFDTDSIDLFDENFQDDPLSNINIEQCFFNRFLSNTIGCNYKQAFSALVDVTLKYSISHFDLDDLTHFLKRDMKIFLEKRFLNDYTTYENPIVKFVTLFMSYKEWTDKEKGDFMKLPDKLIINFFIPFIYAAGTFHHHLELVLKKKMQTLEGTQHRPRRGYS